MNKTFTDGAIVVSANNGERLTDNVQRQLQPVYLFVTAAWGQKYNSEFRWAEWKNQEEARTLNSAYERPDSREHRFTFMHKQLFRSKLSKNLRWKGPTVPVYSSFMASMPQMSSLMSASTTGTRISIWHGR